MSKKINEEHWNKKTPFTVPERYFEQLPQQIQARVRQEPKTYWLTTPVWKLGLSALMFAIVMGVAVYLNNGKASSEELLAEVSNKELIAYLAYEELCDVDVLAEVDLSELSIDESALLELTPEEIEQEIENSDELEFYM